MSLFTRGAARSGITLVILYLKTTNTVSTGVNYMKMDDVSPRPPLCDVEAKISRIQVLASSTCDVIWCLSSSDCNWAKFPLSSVIKNVVIVGPAAFIALSALLCL